MDDLKILVVEDETIIAMELEDRLKELGYHVPAIIASGEEAIAMVPETKPDLILMDIMLKGELDGIQTAEKIGDLYDLPVIYLTANTDPATIERAKITGPYGYLVKPFEEATFKITIEMALYKHNMERELKQRESWLSTTLKSIGEGVVATDVDGNIKFMNRKAEELTGWKEALAVGKPSTDVITLVSTTESQEQTEETQSGPSAEWEDDLQYLQPKAGQKVPVDYSEAPILDDGGRALGSILVFQDITERVKAEKQIRHVASHDPLTNLPNLYLFHDRMLHAIAKAKRDDSFLALLYLDLDGFKQVNDNFGHPCGDELLKLVGQRMQKHVRESDTVARVGGDEFAIVLENTDSQLNAGTAASKILNALSEPIQIKDIKHSISASIGISIYPQDGLDEDTLLRNADNAMYIAKKMGKNRFHYYQAQQ